MGLVRFLAFYDDDNDLVLPPEKLKDYDITLIPCTYRHDGKLYYSGINTDGKAYSAIIKSGDAADIYISADLIQYVYERASENGYLALIVICPHAKYTDCYRAAMLAKKRFYRKKNINDEIVINVIDSRTLGIGTMVFALKTALDYCCNSKSVSMTVQNARKASVNSKTYILSCGDIPFSEDSASVKAYLLHGSKLTPLDISRSLDEVKYDLFTDIVCKSIKNSGGKYSVSFGCDCGFAGNVLGRIERRSDILPLTVAYHGILTTSALGARAFCIHIQ